MTPSFFRRLRRRISAFFLLSVFALAPLSAQEPHPLDALRRAVSEAEDALSKNEPQLMESRYRTALQEGLLLRGALVLQDDDLASALRHY